LGGYVVHPKELGGDIDFFQNKKKGSETA